MVNTAQLLLTDSADPAVAEAVAQLEGWRLVVATGPGFLRAVDTTEGLCAVLTGTDNPNALRDVFERAHARGLPVIVACADETARRRAVELRADEWYRDPAPPDEIAARVRTAMVRARQSGAALAERVERTEYEHMLHDTLTGLPTLPLMIERCRVPFKERGELVVLYFNFVRYSKIEEIYGWEKLDAVLETTAGAVRSFLERSSLHASRVMVSFINDDDFVLFHVPPAGTSAATDSEITEVVAALEREVQARIETAHGEDIAALFDIYVGRAHVYYNAKIRLQRLIYRGIREAANAAKSIEQRERARKVDDLRASLREQAVYVDYHPIVRAATGEVFGYEALARGQMRSLRSPEVMFEVAAEADLVWELSRLCRARAVEGLRDHLGRGELLFLNVDPHDFADPAFTEESLEVQDPTCVVIEITERTAIKDYPKFRERLRAFRERGYRFAVDDAGSGYAGLGSIANLEPDFIKLDISLINAIDTNFIKQNLVETMVRFADDQGAMVIAEGVERAEEYETVKGLGVHLVQGFYIHRPHPAPEQVERTPVRL
ncbi:MAG TPA: EAL domain-containing response regulator [Gemmatimonadales bacterium]